MTAVKSAEADGEDDVKRLILGQQDVILGRNTAEEQAPLGHMVDRTSMGLSDVVRGLNRHIDSRWSAGAPPLRSQADGGWSACDIAVEIDPRDGVFRYSGNTALPQAEEPLRTTGRRCVCRDGFTGRLATVSSLRWDGTSWRRAPADRVGLADRGHPATRSPDRRT